LNTFIATSVVRLATSDDAKYLNDIAKEMAISAAKRGVNIVSRTPEFLLYKVQQSLALISIQPKTGKWIGFCYLEVLANRKYIANSGLIVAPEFRGMGFSKELKEAVFAYSCRTFPNAILFSLTSNLAVRSINRALGYQEISFTSLLADDCFMAEKDTWVNYAALMLDPILAAKYVAMVYWQSTWIEQTRNGIYRGQPFGLAV
jgi:hypothetical protein